MINNICHFVFGMKKQSDDFLFSYYIAVYSAYLINNPDTIYFYYHHEPYGIWYDKLKLIPTIKLVKIDIPTHIGCKEIKKTAHKADWVRMNILYPLEPESILKYLVKYYSIKYFNTIN